MKSTLDARDLQTRQFFICGVGLMEKMGKSTGTETDNIATVTVTMSDRTDDEENDRFLYFEIALPIRLTYYYIIRSDYVPGLGCFSFLLFSGLF